MDIYVKERNFLLRLNLFNLSLRGAILIRMDVFVLYELVLGYHVIKLLHCDEVIMDAILFAWSWLPCRSRYAETKLFRVFVLDEVDQSSFAGTRRAYDN